MALGCTDQNSNVPRAGERVANYVETYLAKHRGLTLGELAFSLKADKRDLQRLLRDRSCGWALTEGLAAYFGDDFVEAIFRPVIGDGPSIRERELERERAEIAARRERMERTRQEARSFRPDPPALYRVASDEDR